MVPPFVSLCLPHTFFFFFGCLLCTAGNNACLMPLLWAVQSRDTVFYDTPRLVYHIDEFAVGALTSYYARTLPPKADVLDLCSSWVSHLPDDYEAGSVTGLGMVTAELDKNPRLTTRVTQDLNENPSLPFEDASFDVITNVVSVDYLTQPLAIFKEMARVLRPGGSAVMSFSNRCFPSKAIDIWLRTSDMEHAFIVGCYFHYAGGFGPPQAQDISPNPGITDPMFIVRAMKR
ncbi:hypothetical protein BU14_2120s0001 [Porphyra umbilicalis]|uniref:Methyltransferase type 11 domain-containing protein n=1 Tax=Porphyra umbilicalis TaxID=2786 RepID=A0A1X6NJV8_PORUM|nr:hypothetical protein BU14_2120s0001 [Porphyra umbilicalis]|eukprot:OSX68894.1 hypothetical protein BU14_2120s0001 [Porphyra umbilicalis]